MWPTTPAPYYLLVKVSSELNISRLCSESLCLEPTPECQESVGARLQESVPQCQNASCGSPNSTLSDPILDKFFTEWPVSEWTYFTEDYLNLVNRHWMSFPPPSRQAHLIFMAFYCLLGLFGLPGNAIVIFMIVSCKSLRTPSNLLVLNLALSDFIMVCKTPLFIYNSFKEGPALGNIGCQLYGFIGGLTGTCSIMSLAAIALDRYFVIAYPLNRDLHTSRLRAIVWIVTIWIYAFVFSVMPIANIGFKPYVPEGYLTSCSFDYLDPDRRTRVFIFSFFCAAWVIPFMIICLSYVGICRAVLMVSMATRMGQEKEKRKKELRLAIVIVFVIALWFVSWTPYAAVALLGIFGRKDLVTPIASMVPAVFCKTASCIDPFIYSLNHPRLRKEMFRIFCPKKYEMYRIETQRSLWKLNESRSSINLKEMKTKGNPPPEEMDLEDVGEPWKKHKGTLSQAGRSNTQASVKSEVMTM